MKQFIMKNIVLAVFLALTIVGSIFLAFFIWQKSQTIKHSMETIQKDGEEVRSINSARKPNSVKESENRIKADTETLEKKRQQIYRHFGKPYRPALLRLIKNITSPAELKTELEVDSSLIAKPKPKTESEEAPEGEEEEVAKTAPAEPSAPTDEEKAVFNPESHLVVLSYKDEDDKIRPLDEDKLRAMLSDIYKDVHQDSSDDGEGEMIIPDTIDSERLQLFEKLFDQIIEAPDVVDPARAEAYRTAAAEKFAKAFAIFRDDVQALTLEDVTDTVAYALFLEALGLPRLMRQGDCRSYIDSMYEKYLLSDLIPGLDDAEQSERERFVQDFIYGKNANRQARPKADRVNPILRSFQIKEDLFRKMKESGIARLRSMTPGSLDGYTLDGDSESPIKAFSYTLEMTASMDAIDTFINSLQSAYTSDRVYVIKEIKLSSPFEDLVLANTLVEDHRDENKSKSSRRPASAAANQNLPDDAQEPVTIDPVTQQPVTVVYSFSEYELTDPHHPDYGKTLFEDIRNEIKCTIIVDYMFYRADIIEKTLQ